MIVHTISTITFSWNCSGLVTFTALTSTPFLRLRDKAGTNYESRE